MKNFYKIIACILVCSMILCSPVVVLAMEVFDDSVVSELKDETVEKDFHYQLSLEETFDVIYHAYPIEEYIKEHIKTKVDVSYEIEIDLLDNETIGNYQLKLDETLIYQGEFSYQLCDTLTIALTGEKEDSLRKYIVDHTKFKENIMITNIQNDIYHVTIGEITADFSVFFYKDELQKEEITPFSTNEINPQVTSSIGVSYSSHVETYGWQDYKQDGLLSGTTGQGKRLEAFKVTLNNNTGITGGISYKSHVEGIGWQDYVGNDALSGTTSQARQVEAIKIMLTGDLANHYDVYYRVHASTYGWLDWASNGSSAGTSGYGLQLEAMEIVVVEKGSLAPGVTTRPYVSPKTKVLYATHVETIGWQNYVENGMTAGTTGKAKQIEAIKINVAYQDDLLGNIEYQTHIEGIGWQDYKKNNQMSGTSGQGRQVEAIRIRLTEQLAENYDIYYRTHVATLGWLGWAKNDESSGTSGFGKQVEAVEIVLVDKNGPAPGNTSNCYVKKDDDITYSSHVSTIGWQNYVKNGELSGTTGKGVGIEALKINLNSSMSGRVNYRTYVQNTDWTTGEVDDMVSGTTGKGKYIEVLKISLEGEIANYYDVYYRVHSSSIGWLDWAKNGTAAGSIGCDKAIEAVEIKLVVKDASAPGATTRPYVSGNWIERGGNTYYYDYFGNMANDFKVIEGIKYFFNSLGVRIGTNVKKILDVSAYQGNINWDNLWASGTIDGVILRVAAGAEVEDAMLRNYIENVKRLNIPYGIYIYSYAENYNEGVYYANFVNNLISKYVMNPSLGIYLDLESNKITSYMGPAQYEQVVRGFMAVIPHAKVYTYTDYANTSLNSAYIRSYITWIAHYNHFCTYQGTYYGWQYSSSEIVPGIAGSVDSSVWFSSLQNA